MRNNRSTVAMLSLLWACLTLMANAGCASLDLSHSMAWLPGMKEKPETPVTLATVWTPSLLERKDGPALRGFGARVIFYARGDRPVRVEGSLVVYAFNERTAEKAPKPDRKFVFTAEQLEEHYSKSKLGPSYSIWVPWDEAGGPAQHVSLIVRFNPVDGPALVGNQSRAALPGPPELNTQPPATTGVPQPFEANPPPQDAQQPEGVQRAEREPVHPIQPVAHYAPPPPRPIGPPRDGPGRRMSTTTISLPPAGT